MPDGPQRLSGLTKRLIAVAAVVVAVVLVGVGYVWGRAAAVPFPTDFWTIAAQPLATLGAAILALIAGSSALIGAHLISSRAQADTTKEIGQRDAAAAADVAQRREGVKDDVAQREKAAGIAELWKRFEWVAEHAGGADGAEGVIDPIQAATIVVSIRDAAKDLGDQQLSGMLNVYMGVQINELGEEIGLPGGA
jgi:hypothetical protein